MSEWPGWDRNYERLQGAMTNLVNACLALAPTTSDMHDAREWLIEEFADQLAKADSIVKLLQAYPKEGPKAPSEMLEHHVHMEQGIADQIVASIRTVLNVGRK